MLRAFLTSELLQPVELLRVDQRFVMALPDLSVTLYAAGIDDGRQSVVDASAASRFNPQRCGQEVVAR